MRIRRIKNVEEKMLDKYAYMIITRPGDLRGKWCETFGKKALYLELGTGKGRFISQKAAQDRDALYVGIDKEPEIVFRAAEKSDRALPNNLKLIHFDGARLDEIFAEDELDHLFLNFSDPWPKNRHEKRRLTFPSFLDQYRKLLKEGGEIHLKTDNRDFFEYSLNSFCGQGWRLKNIRLNYMLAENSHDIMTEYEQRFRDLGQPIYRLEAW